LQSFASLIAEEVAKRLCERGPEKHERLISANEAARRLGISRRSLDRQRLALPFVRPRVSGFGYDVLESGLDEFLRVR
jgi:hypothetical protein